ncbi:MAG TPA: right-handed parallel beta-helix repeat-containing protein [Acetobacteraceae bacterium]|nr:right-handed parallel beta-helix repeat-containing protein [Acetobacteraceae bacterium]
MIRYAFAAVGLVLAMVGAASGETLKAGPGQQYKMPSQAIAHAHDGDTVQIEPGTYFDCAIVRQNNLTIEGIGANVVMTDKPCRGKALLITNGNNITIRNLTLQRVRVPDHNGAGIRAQGGNLTVENTRFLDNEDGILIAHNPTATVRIIDSEFVGNGKCEGNCAHGIYATQIALLDVEHSRFFNTQIGHSIKSRAAKTIVRNCDIEDGPTGTSSYQIDIPNGGTVLIEGNKLEKGPHAQNHGTAIAIGEGGVKHPTESLTIKNNTLINNTGFTTTFVRNITATGAQLSGNSFQGGKVIPLAGDGSVH